MLKVNFSTFEAVDSDCGNIKIEPDFNGRILGGQEATPHNYNWMVVLVLSFANGKIKNFQINFISFQWVIFWLNNLGEE